MRELEIALPCILGRAQAELKLKQRLLISEDGNGTCSQKSNPQLEDITKLEALLGAMWGVFDKLFLLSLALYSHRPFHLQPRLVSSYKSSFCPAAGYIG